MLRRTAPCATPSFKAKFPTFERNRVIQNRKQQNQHNHGLITSEDLGDGFTEPTNYSSRTNTAKVYNTEKRIAALRDEQRLNRFVNPVMSDERLHDVVHRGKAPSSPEEQTLLNKLENEDLMLGRHVPSSSGDYNSGSSSFQQKSRKGSSSSHVSQPNTPVRHEYTSHMHRMMTRESPTEKQNRIAAKFNLEPTAEEYKTIMRRILADEDDEGKVEQLHQRLVEQHALYPTQRIDAYMLGDDSMFPPWVHKLAPPIRDRVKYGGMGITEDDEALRVRLLRMPLDARRAEWDRLKKAKSYAAGITEQKLTPREINAARLAKRRFHWLRRKRQTRATAMKRLALRNPEGFALYPSQQVDYSARLATIAQFVENGVDTKGQWPLDRDELARAKMKKARSEAQNSFMSHSHNRKDVRYANDIMEALAGEEHKEKPLKHLSRKEYGVRVNNVALGVVDERGRPYKDLRRNMAVRTHHMSDGEKQRSKEQETTPTVHMRGHWKRRPPINRQEKL